MRIYEYLGSRKPLIIMRFTSLIYCYPQFLQTKYIPLLTDCSSSTQTIYVDDPTTRPRRYVHVYNLVYVHMSVWLDFFVKVIFFVFLGPLGSNKHKYYVWIIFTCPVPWFPPPPKKWVFPLYMMKNNFVQSGRN